MATKIIEFVNGNYLETYVVESESGGKEGDRVYDTTEKQYHPVMTLGNTNIVFAKDFQRGIHKVISFSKKRLKISNTDVMPVRIQRSRQHKQVSPNGLPIVYVGRPTKWGNPFIVGKFIHQSWWDTFDKDDKVKYFSDDYLAVADHCGLGEPGA